MHNNGPSPISNATLNIFWPIGTKNGDRINDRAARHFILYPTKYTSDRIRCDSTYFNVANLRETRIVIDPEDSGGRETRSMIDTENTVLFSENIILLERLRRQTVIDPTDSGVKSLFNTDISCVKYHDYCVTIKCGMSDIPSGSAYELLITAKIFEPTLALNGPNSIWKITVNSEAKIQDTHVDQPDGGDPDTASKQIRVIPSSLIRVEGFTQWWIIILVIVLFLLIMVPSVIGLYFCGFFKKNKSDKAKLEQSRRENMEELTAAATPDFF